jgi:uncharacterized hydrophobic protein (TIGR00271 family)
MPVRQTMSMLKFQVTTQAALTDKVLAVLSEDPAVSGLAVVRGASLRPPGDVIWAEVPREAANDLVDALRDLGVHEAGSIHVEPVRTWLSRPGRRAEQLAPGSSADAVVWADVTQRAYEESELNWTFVTFMSLATLLAGVAIILDSQILVIGAMILGPEFGAVAALGVALVRRRFSLLRVAARTLAAGFVVGITSTLVAFLVGRALGWVTLAEVTGPRPETAFIYTPDKWSFIVAVIAAAAGVLSLTSARVGGLSGVFISVTTIPAAANVALGLAFGLPDEVGGSALQLAINLTGMAVAGWLTLAFQGAVWARMSAHRTRVASLVRRR